MNAPSMVTINYANAQLSDCIVEDSVRILTGVSEVDVPLATCAYHNELDDEIVKENTYVAQPSTVLTVLNIALGNCSSGKRGSSEANNSMSKECGPVRQLDESGIAMPSQSQWSSLFKSLPKNASFYTPRSLKLVTQDDVFIPPVELFMRVLKYSLII